MPELTPPHLHVPALPSTAFGDGYDWMDALKLGWHPVPAWGLGRWDLGRWPLIIVAHLNDKAHGIYAVATYTEGDITLRAFTDRAERDAATNEIAAFHWRLSTDDAPDDLPPEGEPLLPHHKGRFSWERFYAERGQLAIGKEGDQ